MDKPANRGLPAGGIYKVREDVPFRMLVGNISKSPVTLPSDMLTRVDTKPLEMIMANDELARSSKTTVNTDHRKESKKRWMQVERHHPVATGDENRETHNLRQAVQFVHKFCGYRHEFLKLMEEFETMWGGHLARFSIAKHRI